jgi:hypothetical protein
VVNRVSRRTVLDWVYSIQNDLQKMSTWAPNSDLSWRIDCIVQSLESQAGELEDMELVETECRTCGATVEDGDVIQCNKCGNDCCPECASVNDSTGEPGEEHKDCNN